MSPYLAYAIRIAATGLFFANGILLAVAASAAVIDTSDLLLAGLTGLQGALTYAGIGAVSKTLEPEVGIRKL
jgi:hypothetical protein